MKTKTLSIDLPRIDGDTQSRIKINDDAVSDYAEVIEASGKTWPFPPIDVFFDGTDYYVADGFQRLLAGLRTKRGSIPCQIHNGTAKDARIFGMTANDKQGLRLSRADKKSNIEWLMDNGGKMTQKAIAEAVGVVVRTVSSVVADRKYEATPPKPKPDKRGSNTQVAYQAPEGGDSEPVDDEPPAEETPEPPPKAKGKPPKQFDRSYWYRQYDQAIGPLCRLVDKIANNIGESGCDSKKVVQSRLNGATEKMAEWMGVKPK